MNKEDIRQQIRELKEDIQATKKSKSSYYKSFLPEKERILKRLKDKLNKEVLK
jgi:cell division septum initiation protein DivIVA